MSTERLGGYSMARPRKEGMDYFPHDTDAVNDEKIEALRALYGNDGYAFYFILLERIYRSNNFELDVSDTETIQILSRKISVTTQEFEKMLQTALKWKCFDAQEYQNKGVLTSNGIKKRASIVVEKREQMRQRYEKQKGISAAETREETEEETPQSKVKKSKEKNICIHKKSYGEDGAVKLTDEEYQKLKDQLGNELKHYIDSLNNYIKSKGKKYKSHYHTILAWYRKDQKEKPKKRVVKDDLSKYEDVM